MRERLSTIVLAVALAAVFASSPAFSQESRSGRKGAITGQVVGPGGAPQAGALVMAGDREVTTGADGRFRFDSIPAGVYEVSLFHPERGRSSIRVPVGSGTTTGVEITYERDGGVSRSLSVGGLPATDESNDRSSGESRIVGRLVDRTTDRPIESAVVRLPSLERRASTSGRGRFTFDSLAAGTYTLRIHHVRYGDRSAEVEVPDDRTVDVDVRLAPQAVQVEPVKVTVDATVRRPALQGGGYYERKRWARKAGYGHFLEAEEVENRGSEVSHVLGSVPQLTATGPVSVGGRLVRGLVYFQRHTGCMPAIYLDGHKVVGSGGAGEHVAALGPRGVNSLASPNEIAGIEVYESPAETAGEFQGSDSRCGVVAIWTKRQ